MPGSVSQIRPLRGSFAEALDAFRTARLRSCLALLGTSVSAAVAALRARALLRLGSPRDAFAASTGVTAGDPRERGELALLAGVASSRLGERERADDFLTEARVFGISSMDVSLEAEVEFYAALTAFGDGAVEDARAACRRGLDAGHASTIEAARTSSVPLAHVVSRIRELLGLLDAAEGRYRDQLAHARAALDTLATCPIGDVYQEAFALKNLATLARDFDLDDEARRLAERVADLAWTSDISRVEFTTVESLAWCSSLRGDTVDALRLLRRAASVATTDPERINVSVDRAIVARGYGHGPMVAEELEHALALSSAYDWNHAPGDSRLYLLPLVQNVAAIDVVRARETLNRYTAIRNAMDATFAARVEVRVRAEEAYTHGIVLRAEGRTAASVERLHFAFATWSDIGYAWRAARAALELAELQAGDIFRSAVRRELSMRPASVFAARARLVA